MHLYITMRDLLFQSITNIYIIYIYLYINMVNGILLLISIIIQTVPTNLHR